MKTVKKTRSLSRTAKIVIAVTAITTTMSGIVTYRTQKPMTEKRGAAFARMIVANPKFLDATVVRSRKAGYVHVCYLPSNLDRIAAIIDAEDAKDRAAAARDGSLFLYTETRTGSFVCEGKTGTYEVNLRAGSCTCPHYTYRRRASGGRCKHLVELERRRGIGLIA
jgi:hypothetical protein